jgi:hypothetical protein
MQARRSLAHSSPGVRVREPSFGIPVRCDDGSGLVAQIRASMYRPPAASVAGPDSAYSAGKRSPFVRNIPARSPSVAIAGKAGSHGRGSYQIGAHDPVAGGQDSTAVAVLTAVAMLMASVANTYLGAGHEARAGCL